MKTVINIEKGSRNSVFLLLEEGVLYDYEISLGSNTDFKLLLLCNAKLSESYDFKLSLVHTGENIQSAVFTNVVAFDDAQVKAYTNLRVENGISNVATSLKQKALLFSDSARIVFDPVLEISDNRLTGSHSASISRPSRQDTYYMMSRGLSKKQAEELFIGQLLNVPEGYLPIDTLLTK